MCSRFGPRTGKIKVLLAAFALVLVFYGGCRGAGVEVISGKGKKINLGGGKILHYHERRPYLRGFIGRREGGYREGGPRHAPAGGDFQLSSA